MKQSISSEISNTVLGFAQQRLLILNQYHNSLTVAKKLRDLESSLHYLKGNNTPAQNIHLLGSGQPPEEIRLTVTEIEQEIEKIKLWEAEVKQLEMEIKKIQARNVSVVVMICSIAFSEHDVGKR
jgi:hypothetical protein